MFNFKEIISSIADVGQKIFNIKDIKKNDIDSILSLCDDLISNKGAAFGITVARDVVISYQELSLENKLEFFKRINEKYKASFTEVDQVIDLYKSSPNEKTLANLFKASEGKRRELFNRMNMAPNGTSIIVKLREDLLKVLKNKHIDHIIMIFKMKNADLDWDRELSLNACS